MRTFFYKWQAAGVAALSAVAAGVAGAQTTPVEVDMTETVTDAVGSMNTIVLAVLGAAATYIIGHKALKKLGWI